MNSSVYVCQVRLLVEKYEEWALERRTSGQEDDLFVKYAWVPLLPLPTFWKPRSHLSWACLSFRGTRNCHLECAEGMVQVQSRQGSTLRTAQAFTDGDIAHTSARGLCLRPFKYAPRWYSVAISIVSYIESSTSSWPPQPPLTASIGWADLSSCKKDCSLKGKIPSVQAMGRWRWKSELTHWYRWNVLRRWFRTFEWHQVLQLRLGDQILAKQSTTVREIFNQWWLEKRSGRSRYVFSACY